MTKREKAYRLYHDKLRERFNQSDTDILEFILFDFLSGDQALEALEEYEDDRGLYQLGEEEETNN